jgi:hypothetical protein
VQTFLFGGEDGIRTHARVAPTNGLANRPLRPLEYLSICIWQGQQDLNPQPTVLETATLPIELYPCIWCKWPDSNRHGFLSPQDFKSCVSAYFTTLANGGESGIRTHGSLTTTPVFKTGALNQLDHLSII